VCVFVAKNASEVRHIGVVSVYMKYNCVYCCDTCLSNVCVLVAKNASEVRRVYEVYRRI
jgi:hypothetical protein